ncbi:hypothetical protein SAMN05421805_1154 [Saccharopolyspora antimicrobica]|uniref:GGDEF domain-containing protein n=1 Tax=Saccharopolyspora antimicrobica TaxID=455193 RepID=A0A1I5HA85_9PSEU|nr:hypothetical protein ATL45_3757 [Saccharopolyspora antimicrobica]SFO45117.1 hypothetical protein SAMN05421805_1154 [Saccharopolyspora antimicrobica]
MREWSFKCDATISHGRQRALRSRWRTASLAAGWPFPSDWASDAVDAVCAAVVEDRDLAEALADLGAARAEAGVGLAGTLQDLAALHAVATGAHDGLVSADPDAVPTAMVRTTALGWSDVIARLSVGREVEDPLTGLTTVGYLRTRLHEVYRAARAEGRSASEDYVLLTVSLDSPADGYPRMMAMVLMADVLRTAFDSGETVSLLRSATAAVLTKRNPQLSARCLHARCMIEHRLAADPALHACQEIRFQQEPLPADHTAACDLLASL